VRGFSAGFDRALVRCSGLWRRSEGRVPRAEEGGKGFDILCTGDCLMPTINAVMSPPRLSSVLGPPKISFAERPAIAARPTKVRSAVTNDPLMLRGVEGGSMVARRYGDA
jgi:hypothetical protein